MGHLDFPFLSIDREYERAELDDEAFRAEVERLTPIKAAGLRTKAAAGDADTLTALDEDLAHRLGQPGVMTQLIRAALSSGPISAGVMLLGLIGMGVDLISETAALEQIESREPA